MGLGQNILTLLGSYFLLTWLGWVSNLWVWKISTKNHKFLDFFPSDQKISFGLVKKYPGQRRVGPLF